MTISSMFQVQRLIPYNRTMMGFSMYSTVLRDDPTALVISAFNVIDVFLEGVFNSSSDSGIVVVRPFRCSCMIPPASDFHVPESLCMRILSRFQRVTDHSNQTYDALYSSCKVEEIDSGRLLYKYASHSFLPLPLTLPRSHAFFSCRGTVTNMVTQPSS